MRDYELTLILRPDLGDEALAGMTERVGRWISGAGGEVEKVTTAGRKRLAFSIDHVRDGLYVLFQLRARPDVWPDVERNLKLSDEVLRHMVVRR